MSCSDTLWAAELQVTRRWMNWEGEAVAQHLARQLAAMEKDPRLLALCHDSAAHRC